MFYLSNIPYLLNKYRLKNVFKAAEYIPLV